MENRYNQENSLNKKDKDVPEDLPLNFLFKKTEKLAVATYLVTGLFPDREPLKWTLRKKSLSLLSDILSFYGNKAGNLNKLYSRDAVSPVLEMMSLLEVARSSGTMSEMNSSVLFKEYKDLANYINQAEEKRKSDISLSQDFFRSDAESGYRLSESSENFNKRTDLYERSVSEIKRLQEDSKTDMKSERKTEEPVKRTFDQKDIKDKTSSIQNPQRSKRPRSSDADKRRTKILLMFRKQPELTVKDISSVITDCSEKTIQRELGSMVSEGTLKKEGNKRWSKYVLNDHR